MSLKAEIGGLVNMETFDLSQNTNWLIVLTDPSRLALNIELNSEGVGSYISSCFHSYRHPGISKNK